MSKSKLVAAALVTAILALPFAAPAQAYQCKNSYSQAEALGNNRFMALKNARTSGPTR
jgi:hypothetical protein